MKDFFFFAGNCLSLFFLLERIAAPAVLLTVVRALLCVRDSVPSCVSLYDFSSPALT